MDLHENEPTPPSASHRPPADPTRQHFQQLDGLRGIAILMVVACHLEFLYQPPSHVRGPLAQLSQGGWMGVDLFFVLSGFLITGILLATRDGPGYFRNFLARRFLRIWPLYYANLIVFFVLLPLALPKVPHELQSMIDHQSWFWLYGANWLFAREHGFNHTGGGYFWSLAVEEQFYLIWPFVVLWLSPRALLRTSIALLLSSIALRVLLVALGVNIFSLYTITFTHLDGLAIGSVLAIVMRRGEPPAWLKSSVAPVFFISLAALACVWMADGSLYYWNRHMVLIGYASIALVAGTLVFWSLQTAPSGLWNRALRSAPLVKIGRLSYGVYLIHPPIAGFAAAHLMPRLAKVIPHWPYLSRYCLLVATVAAVTWALALASWNLFEKRLLALKRYFEYEHSAASPSAPQPEPFLKAPPETDIAR